MVTLLITGGASAVSLVTILGNLLVLLSIRANRHLQTVNNYYLFSLACADLLMGMFSMNVYTAYVLMGRWPFGPLMCHLWLVVNYVVSNASNMHLLLISVDRYLCVTRPLTYPSRRTRRYAGLMVLAAWVLSLVLWAPAILTWQRFHGQWLRQKDECYIQLLSNPTVTLATAVPSFYLPAVLVTVLYARISRAGRRHSDRQSRAPNSLITATHTRFHGASTSKTCAPPPTAPSHLIESAAQAGPGSDHASGQLPKTGKAACPSVHPGWASGELGRVGTRRPLHRVQAALRFSVLSARHQKLGECHSTPEPGSPACGRVRSQEQKRKSRKARVSVRERKVTRWPLLCAGLSLDVWLMAPIPQPCLLCTLQCHLQEDLPESSAVSIQEHQFKIDNRIWLCGGSMN